MPQLVREVTPNYTAALRTKVQGTMIGRFAILFLIAAAACTLAPAHVSLPAPNPNGCYVIVHDRADFGGIGDVFNGPGRWPRLPTAGSHERRDLAKPNPKFTRG